MCVGNEWRSVSRREGKFGQVGESEWGSVNGAE